MPYDIETREQMNGKCRSAEETIRAKLPRRMFEWENIAEHGLKLRRLSRGSERGLFSGQIALLK